MSGLTLNRLRPGPCEEVAASVAYRYPEGTRRHLRVNMVSSIDGAATLDGHVGTLTGPADQRLLVLLRALADVLVVGAGTIRAEGYGPLTVDPELRPLREQAGQGPAPRLVVPTRSLDLDFGSAAFAEAVEPPLVVTTSLVPADRLRAAKAVAEVIVLGEHAVDLDAMVHLLAERGAGRILCEGGPALLNGLLSADLVDELCLAVAPVVASGHESRITAGPPLPAPLPMHLAQVAERDEFLFLSYSRISPKRP